MGRSRESLAREGRNGLASHALFATAPAPYSTVPGSCLRHVGERKEYHRLCPWDPQAERRACLRGRKLPNPLGCWVRLWRGLEVGWQHPLQHRERATTHLGRLSTPSPRAPAGAADRDGGVFGHRRLRVRQGAEIQVIGAEILWTLAPRA